MSAAAGQQLTTAENSATRLYCQKSRARQDLSRYYFLLKILTFRGFSLETYPQREGENNIHSDGLKKIFTHSPRQRLGCCQFCFLVYSYSSSPFCNELVLASLTFLQQAQAPHLAIVRSFMEGYPAVLIRLRKVFSRFHHVTYCFFISILDCCHYRVKFPLKQD